MQEQLSRDQAGLQLQTATGTGEKKISVRLMPQPADLQPAALPLCVPVVPRNDLVALYVGSDGTGNRS